MSDSFEPNGEAHLARRMTSAEGRLKLVEDEGTETNRLLKEIHERLGHPEDGDHKATGVYFLLDGLNKRMAPLERLRERAVGAITVGIPILAGSGAVIWFLAGAKLAKLFHG